MSTPLNVNLGLSGLGLNVNGGVQLGAGFDAVLGFGVSKETGFYVDSSDSLSVNFDAQMNAAATGTLGFFQLSVSKPTGPRPSSRGL